MRSLILTIVASAALAGCATHSREVAPQYVPVARYASYSCGQLSADMQRIGRRYADLSGVQDENSRSDTIKVGVAAAGLALGGVGLAAGSSAAAVATAVGVVGGASALALVHGDSANTNQIAFLKGELDAAERTFIERNCSTRGPMVIPAPVPQRR
jgi:hypothetical protein